MKYSVLLFIILCCTQNLFGQENKFEKKAAHIAHRIDSITLSEKSILKIELIKIDKKFEKKELSFLEAEAAKKDLANYHAKKINDAVFIEEQKLQQLIRNRVSGKLEFNDIEKESNKPFLSVFEDENFYKDSISGLKVEKRLTTQFVVAFSTNMVLGDDEGFYGEGFKDNPIGSGELGFTFKYRMKENTNLWNLKFGLSMMTEDLKPKADNDIVVTNNDQTTLEDAGFDIKNSRFTSMSFAIPLHLELDFSKPQYHKKTEQTYMRSHRGFRMGLGGYFGVRFYNTNLIKYKMDGKRIRMIETDDFNVNTITYGPSIYIGYRDLSLYAKYDFNPVFKNNPEDINILSIGLRLDLN